MVTRAKNAEYRSAKISADTFQFLNCYIAEYRKILQHQSYLFVNISGRTVGNPLTVDAVYAMLKRMEKKTGIKITPHMLRHYFGNEKKKSRMGTGIDTDCLWTSSYPDNN